MFWNSFYLDFVNAMAEAAVEISRFFCHSCNRHFANNSTELECPHCNSGFVEQIEHNTGPGNAASSGADAEGTSSQNAPSALDMLRGSLLHYWPNVASPEDNPDSVSYFSINFRPERESREQSSSNEQPSSSTPNEASDSPRPTFNFRIRTRRRINPTDSTETGGAASNDGQTRSPMTPNVLIEDLLQQLLNGADPGAILGGGANVFGTAAGGNFPRELFALHGNPQDYAWGANGLDDVITQMLGQLENTGPPPASTVAIKELPVLTITEDHAAANKDCSVCMETFIIDVKAKKLPCEHFFHIECIDPWLELHNSCPVCRTNIEHSGPCPRASSSSHGGRSTSGPSTSGV